MYDSLVEAVAEAEAQRISLGELALRTEAGEGLRTRAEIEAALARALEVMRNAVAAGSPWRPAQRERPGRGRRRKDGPTGRTRSRARCSPTCSRPRSRCRRSTQRWGSSSPRQQRAERGCCPVCCSGLAKHRPVEDAALIRALATAGLVGAVVAVRASLSGAEGGCQAETGAAAGMAAAAGVELLGGSPTEAVACRRPDHAGHPRPGLRSPRRAGRGSLRLSERHRRGDGARRDRDGPRRGAVSRSRWTR